MSEIIYPYIAINQPTPTLPEMMLKLNDIMMDKLLWIGLVAMVCGAWHMSKYSRKNTPRAAFITGLIDMASLGAGVAAIGFYAVFKGWL